MPPLTVTGCCGALGRITLTDLGSLSMSKTSTKLSPASPSPCMKITVNLCSLCAGNTTARFSRRGAGFASVDIRRTGCSGGHAVPTEDDEENEADGKQDAAADAEEAAAAATGEVAVAAAVRRAAVAHRRSGERRRRVRVSIVRESKRGESECVVCLLLFTGACQQQVARRGGVGRGGKKTRGGKAAVNSVQGKNKDNKKAGSVGITSQQQDIALEGYASEG